MAATDTVRTRDLMGTAQVRRMLGRAFREDRKPITRHTLIGWREKRGFPGPVDAPHAGVELWDRRQVRKWIAEQGT